MKYFYRIIKFILNYFSQLETPGFFDSFSMVSSFLNQLANSVFLSPVGRRSNVGDGAEGGLVRPRRGHRLSRRSSTMQVCEF